jgi:hypothetical protein
MQTGPDKGHRQGRHGEQRGGQPGLGSPGTGQEITVVDPALLDDEDRRDPLKDVEYLLAAGWKKVAKHDTPNPTKCWLDPQSGKPDRQVLVVPAARDVAGRITQDEIYQTVAGIPPWCYSRKEAVQIQRDRDEAKGKKKP